MLKRNLSLIALSSTLMLPAAAHELSFGAGALSINMFNQLTFTDTKLAGPTPTIVFDSNANTVTGEIYVGYAYNVNRGFDIAAEVFYDFNSPKLQQYVADQSFIQVDYTNQIGVRVLPGFNITPSTRFFIDVAYLFLEGQLQTSKLLNASDFVNTTTTTTTNKWSGAIQYGAGFETMIYESFGLRASYTVTPTINSNASHGTSVTSKDGTLTYSTKPTFYAFYLGGIFRFGF
jgi:hypothetical protein